MADQHGVADEKVAAAEIAGVHEAEDAVNFLLHGGRVAEEIGVENHAHAVHHDLIEGVPVDPRRVVVPVVAQPPLVETVFVLVLLENFRAGEGNQNRGDGRMKNDVRRNIFHQPHRFVDGRYVFPGKTENEERHGLNSMPLGHGDHPANHLDGVRLANLFQRFGTSAFDAVFDLLAARPGGQSQQVPRPSRRSASSCAT